MLSYRPDQDAFYRDKLIENFERAVNLNPNVLIMGGLIENVLNGTHGSFIDFMCSFLNVDQLVMEPTRVTTTTSTVIYVILTSFKSYHIETSVLKTCLGDGNYYHFHDSSLLY